MRQQALFVPYALHAAKGLTLVAGQLPNSARLMSTSARRLQTQASGGHVNVGTRPMGCAITTRSCATVTAPDATRCSACG